MTYLSTSPQYERCFQDQDTDWPGRTMTSEVKPKEECVRERKRTYEMMFIISPLHADDESVADVVNRIRQSIETQGGEVLSVNHSAPWGRRKLAYPIRAYAGGESSRRIFTEGFYVLMHIMLASTKVAELERTLKLLDPILRYLVTVVEQKDEVPGISDETQVSSEADDDMDDEHKGDEENPDGVELAQENAS